MNEFTDNELMILRALYASMKGNGFDFGFADDCRIEGKTPRQCQATLRGPHKKLLFSTDDEFNQVFCDWTVVLRRGTTFEEWLAAIPRTR